MKATVLEMIVVESKQNENSWISSGITQSNPTRFCALYLLKKRIRMSDFK